MTVTENHDPDTASDASASSSPEARRLRRELFSDDLVDDLLARAGERGVALTGKGGFLPEMIKAVLGGCQMVCVSGGSDLEGVHYDGDRKPRPGYGI